MTRLWALVAAGCLSAAAPDFAQARPSTARRLGFFESDLRLHRGDTQQDEVPHYGLYPSIVVRAGFALSERFDVLAGFAAAKTSAVWENIGGRGNGFLGVGFHPNQRQASLFRFTLTAGVAFPTRDKVPTAACFQPDQKAGESLVYSFGENTSCWDRSALRRAALHRGGKDIWMWAPDWVTAVVTGRVETTAEQGLYVGAEASLGQAASTLSAPRSGGAATLTQLTVEAGYLPYPGLQVGMRGLVSAVFLDAESPAVLSVEPFVKFRHASGAYGGVSFMLPLHDFRNEDVPPGLGGYKITEFKALGLNVGAEL